MVKSYLLDGKGWRFEESEAPEGAVLLEKAKEPQNKAAKPKNKAKKAATK